MALSGPAEQFIEEGEQKLHPRMASVVNDYVSAFFLLTLIALSILVIIIGGKHYFSDNTCSDAKSDIWLIVGGSMLI
ncbi:unnamed protein product, partial [marine sediment metagenome]